MINEDTIDARESGTQSNERKTEKKAKSASDTKKVAGVSAVAGAAMGVILDEGFDALSANAAEPTEKPEEESSEGERPEQDNPETATTPEPTANNQQPTANSQQPTTNNQQPTANSQQPTANSQQPTANSFHQTANNQHPAANSPHPVANSADDFFQKNDIKIVNIETKVADSGEVVHIAHGTMNGHVATFVDNGDGKITVAAVDLNDDDTLQLEELAGMEGTNITMQNLTDHLVTEADLRPEEPAATPAGSTGDEVKVEVIAVHDDMDMNGNTVDIAEITVNEEPVLLIDTTQDGDANLLVVDSDGSGDIDESEIHDITDDHLPMPTQADVTDSGMLPTALDATQSVEADELPDYSNNADITMFDV